MKSTVFDQNSSTDGASKHWSGFLPVSGGSSTSTLTSSSTESMASNDKEGISTNRCHDSSREGCCFSDAETSSSSGTPGLLKDWARSKTTRTSGSDDYGSRDSSNTYSMGSHSGEGSRSTGKSNTSPSSQSSQTPRYSSVDLVVGEEGEVLVTVEDPFTGVMEASPLRHIFHVSDNLVMCCSSGSKGPLYKQKGDSSSATGTSLLLPDTSFSPSPCCTCTAADKEEPADLLATGPTEAGGRCLSATAAAAENVFHNTMRNGAAVRDAANALYALRFATVHAAEAFVSHASRHNTDEKCRASCCAQTKREQSVQCTTTTSSKQAGCAGRPGAATAAAAAAELDACAAAASTAAVGDALEEDFPVDCSAECLKDEHLDIEYRRRSLRTCQQPQDKHEEQQQEGQHEQGSGREQHLQRAQQQQHHHQRTWWCPTRRTKEQQQTGGVPGQQVAEGWVPSAAALSGAFAAAAVCTPLQQMEAGAVENYFYYYGKLANQMNILQDTVRTAAYYNAVMNNKVDFAGKVVMDVGAGSGILSFFAAQAGAKKVYAVEASRMAKTIELLCRKNPDLGQRIVVLHACIEQLTSADVPEKVDVLVSEPLGTFLFNERMIETYLIARDRFLKPGGKMYPSRCKLAVAPFTDAALYQEFLCKADMWKQQKFFGVDLTAAHGAAVAESFGQPVVDLLDPALLVAPAQCRVFDWRTLPVDVLRDIYLPLQYVLPAPAVLHGLAGWFDVGFDGSSAFSSFSTSPFDAPTHWYQTRFLFAKPLAANEHQRVKGFLRLVGNKQQSYDIFASLELENTGFSVSASRVDLKDPVYRYFSASTQSYNCAGAASQYACNTCRSNSTPSAYDCSSHATASGSDAAGTSPSCGAEHHACLCIPSCDTIHGCRSSCQGGSSRW